MKAEELVKERRGLCMELLDNILLNAEACYRKAVSEIDKRAEKIKRVSKALHIAEILFKLLTVIGFIGFIGSIGTSDFEVIELGVVTTPMWVILVRALSCITVSVVSFIASAWCDGYIDKCDKCVKMLRKKRLNEYHEFSDIKGNIGLAKLDLQMGDVK